MLEVYLPACITVEWQAAGLHLNPKHVPSLHASKLPNTAMFVQNLRGCYLCYGRASNVDITVWAGE